MIQPIQVVLNNYEYALLRDFALHYNKWTKSHYSASKAYGIAPEPIVGIMYEKYFKRPVEDIIISRNGKKINFHYYEGKAIYDVMAPYSDIGVISIRAKFDKALTDWIPCPVTQNMEQWYNKNITLINTFGAFKELDEISYEIVVTWFNRETNNSYLKTYESNI